MESRREYYFCSSCPISIFLFVLIPTAVDIWGFVAASEAPSSLESDIYSNLQYSRQTRGCGTNLSRSATLLRYIHRYFYGVQIGIPVTQQHACRVPGLIQLVLGNLNNSNW